MRLDRTSCQSSSVSVTLRCPSCLRQATFEPVEGVPDLVNETDQRKGDYFLKYVMGQRRCPNEQCRDHIFFIYDISNAKLIHCYPPERTDFDHSGIPGPIVKTF